MATGAPSAGVAGGARQAMHVRDRPVLGALTGEVATGAQPVGGHRRLRRPDRGQVTVKRLGLWARDSMIVVDRAQSTSPVNHDPGSREPQTVTVRAPISLPVGRPRARRA